MGAVGRTGIATGGVFFAGTAVRENSAVLLRYQIMAPPPMTATKRKSANSSPRQDFMKEF